MSDTDSTRNTSKIQPEQPAHRRRAAEDLAKSGITLDEAELHGAYSTKPLDTRRLTQDGMAFNSLLFYYAGLDGKPVQYTNSAGESHDFIRARMYPDDPDALSTRYWQPPGSGCALFLPAGVPWDKVLKDTSLPIYLTEGEKKSIKATIERFITVAVGGVHNFVKMQELLPELVRLAKGGRPMYIVYDGDDVWNEGVREAMNKLARMLAEAGANVGIISLPSNQKLDDYLVEHGAESFAALPIKAWNVRKSLSAVREGNQNAFKKKQQASNLIRGHMLEQGSFYRSKLNETFYFSSMEKVLLRLDDIKATRLRSYLADHYGTNASEHEYKYVMEDIQTHSVRHGTLTEVHIFSHWSAATGVLYIAAGDHMMFKVTNEGYSLVSNGTDEVLISNCEGPQLIPADDVDVNADYFGKPFKIPNYEDHGVESMAALAMKAYTLTILFPEANPTKIIPLFCGPKGSHKTSAERALIQLVLGPDYDVLNVDSNIEKDIWTHVDKYPICGVDNVDGLLKGLANCLATISTGGAKTKRKLWTDTEEILIPIRSGVMASSRNPKSFGRGDIVDRLLVFACARQPGKFKPESVVQAETRALRPYWWADLLRVLPDVISAMQDAPPGREFEWRMADYANMLYTAAPALGYTEQDADAVVAWQTKERSKFAAEHGSLVGLLRAYHEKYSTGDTSGFEGRMAAWFKARTLFGMLQEVYTGRNFPFESEVSLGRSMAEDWETVAAECDYLVRKADKKDGGWKYKWVW